MKTIWLCNVVLPDFCEEFGIKRTVIGGWITGMLSELEKYNEVEVTLCFPIFDPARLKNGEKNNHKYYTFLCDALNYNDRMKNDFKKILTDYKPDTIHIWGTEHPHSLAMVNACEELGMLDKVVVNIQGYVHIYAKHYFASIENKYTSIYSDKYRSIEAEKTDMANRGLYETQILNKISHVIGRTEWDKACSLLVNPKLKYHFCNEIIRNSFYENSGAWDINKICRHSIFVSQAHYPIKGLHFLLEAISIVVKKFPDAHINVGGFDLISEDKDGYIKPYGQYIISLIDKYSLSNNVSFLGMLNEDQMCEQYFNANVYVIPSSIENSPNSMCEAMMIGMPVIASYVGGNNCLIEHNKSGLLYQHDSSYMLAYHIMNVFENDDFAKYLSKNASSRALDINNKYINCKRNIEIYNEIINSYI